MNTKDLSEKLAAISKPPVFKTEEYENWLQQEDFFQLLMESRIGDIPLYVSFEGVYLYSVFIPDVSLKGNYVDDLMRWSCGPANSWGYGYSYGKGGKPRKIFISAPFDSPGSGLLKKASPITFLRSFQGRLGNKRYVEVNLQLVHLHGLHYLEERSAYCRFDKDGDLEEVIKTEHIGDGIVTTTKQDCLNFHLFLTKTVLIRFFNRTLCNDLMRFSEKSRDKSMLQDKPNEIYARRGVLRNRDDVPAASFVRGLQIVRNTQSRRKMIAILDGKAEPKKYEKFITLDFKHKRIAECSCDPTKLGNYSRSQADPSKPLLYFSNQMSCSSTNRTRKNIRSSKGTSDCVPGKLEPQDL